MEQLGEFDGNGHRRRNNINNFAPIYESDDEEGTQHMTKSKITSIVLSDKYKEKKNKGGQNKSNEEYGNYW